MKQADIELGGHPAYAHYDTEALLPTEYVFLFAEDLSRGNHPDPGSGTWALVTGVVRRKDDPAKGWLIYTLLPTGEEFLHYRSNPTVVRAATELHGVPHAFDPSNLSAQVAVATARLSTAQKRLDRLRSLAYLADALEHGRQTTADRAPQEA